MAVYLFTSYDILDQERYASYVPNVLPIMEKYGGEILSADTEAQMVDGEPKDINVILKFPTEEDASLMMQDPDYLPWLNLRLETTTNRLSVFMKGFVPPT